MVKKSNFAFAKHLYKVPLFIAALLICGVAVLPMMAPKEADAAQITDRSLTLSSGQPGATGVTYSFTFKLPTAIAVQGLKFIACDLAVSTYPGNTSGCTPPTGFNAAGGGFQNVSFGSQSNWQGATNFAVDTTGANDCVPSATNHNIICATRTDATNQTANTSRTISFSTIKNPTANNYAFYVGIYTYSTANYVAPQTDFGATASAVTQALTTNAAVAEILNFCVGSTTVDDVSSLIATDCAGAGGTAVTGTSVNLGTLDTSAINVTPWNTNCTQADCNHNAVAMVRSNAGNGTTISYDAIQQSGTIHKGTLRISGATCDDPSGTGTPSGGIVGTNDQTDSCINAAGSTLTTFTAGQEKFGMTIAGINYGSTTSYTCSYGDAALSIAAGDTCNLIPLTNYIGGGTTGSPSTYTYDSANGFAWDETGTAVNIASSGTSTVKQIDDEALVIKYAATPQITTPFGPYQAQTDFIAVPVY
jgi:hypothetical protein